MPVAVFGPLLATLTVKLTVLPTSASAGVTNFATDTSACGSTAVSTVAALLAPSGSVVSGLDTVAVWTIGSGVR